MKKRIRSPEEILDALEDQYLADECDRVAALSDAEVDRELAAIGVDPASIREGADEVFERAMRIRASRLSESAPAETTVKEVSADGARPIGALAAQVPTGRRDRPPLARVAAVFRPERRMVMGLAALAAVLLLAIGGWRLFSTRQGVEARSKDQPSASGEPEASGPAAAERARVLRSAAFSACDARRWSECLRLLDQARDLDLAGDRAPRVHEARESARRGME